MTATAQHVAEITEAMTLFAPAHILLGAYDSKLDGAELRADDSCERCDGSGKVIVGRNPQTREETFDACGNCFGLGYAPELYLTTHDCQITFAGSAIEEEVLALVVFAEEILSAKFRVADPTAVAECCLHWRDEQHLRDLIRYWSSRLAVGEFDRTDEAALVEAANELPVDERQHLLPQHQRALLLDAAALLLEGHEDLRFEGERLRKLAQDALEEGR